MNVSIRSALRGTVVGGLMAVASLSVAQDASAAQRRGCQAVGNTVLANRFVRVFEQAGRTDVFSFAVCARGARRAHHLFDSSVGSDFDPDQATIGGWNVAYVSGRCRPGPDPHQGVGCRGRIVIYNARSRRIRSIPVASNREGTAIFVSDVAVTARGSAAWLIRNTDDPTLLELWTTSPTGPRRIDAATVAFDSPAETSLALSGSRLYWQIGPQPRSLVLP